MLARLTALVGSTNSLSFDIKEPKGSAWGQWTHHSGISKADGSEVSVFRIAASNGEDAKLQSARNGVKRLRTVCVANLFL